MVSNRVFNNIKNNSIKIWKTYDDTYGYQTEKVSRVNSITNEKGNWMVIVGMFDQDNQKKLIAMLSKEARELVERYI